MWGRGIYFAEDSRYSCPSYSYKVPYTSNTYEIFFSLVLIGDSIDLKGNSDNTLKAPPLKPGSSNEHYDSVKAFTNQSNIYIVYKNVKTYPSYLVRYSL
jgi:hypothetical protein